MSLQKTKISHINEGFDFLSQTVRKYKKKLIIQPSKKSTKRLLGRVRRLIHKNRSATQTHLINVLTPQIRGWAYYHRYVCSRKTFERVDHETFRSLWLWSKRRHRNKGAGWIKSKYFEESATRQWCFAPGKCKSTAERVTLFQATNVPIRRRVKIKADANPFDTAWKTYFQQRQRRGTIINKMSDNLEVNPSPVIERQCYMLPAPIAELQDGSSRMKGNFHVRFQEEGMSRMAFSRFLDPKVPLLTKRLFGTEKNKDILIYFINSVLNRTGSDMVADVTYLKSDQNPEYAYKKQSVVDVLCRDQTGTQFIIEMQVAKTPGFEERAQFYEAKAYIKQMNSGGKYPDLKEVIFIAITDYVMFPDKLTWKSDHVTLDKKTFEHDYLAAKVPKQT